ncbi:PhoH-like protein [Limihaloglobus sulfuriphilus]|uniref:PhoH-like protein n=1 Tax=Limihaloglobus sulfuriphilus TaxID=1851148 RepID=A0A1Q2MAR4_9BACT|nr:PhoH family protein [Limihaloglobus sulfuriphilus]AQQ69776.1 PhoH-like protein [Limihaloglobus sulfuriphilus]
MEKILNIDDNIDLQLLFGPRDEFLKIVRDNLEVRIVARERKLNIAGEQANVDHAVEVFAKLITRLNANRRFKAQDIHEIIFQVRGNIDDISGDAIKVYSPKAIVEPFTRGQINYVRTMRKNDLTFCTGPAGTGKTYLAVAIAVSMLKAQKIRKIVLVRPAVEAGEKLGFLPGDIEAKVNPYLRPLFDALEDVMEFGQMKRFMSMDIIEVIPLAFMRGRTLNEAVIICDEAQNTTPSQMLMFLTRLGRNSKMIVTGDLTQMDLSNGYISGLQDAFYKLNNMKGVGFVNLEKADIVRHKLVQNIVHAYEMSKAAGPDFTRSGFDKPDQIEDNTQ